LKEITLKRKTRMRV